MTLRMVSEVFKGVISTFTGGLFFDFSQTHFTNIIHFYIWILFFIFPLVLYLIAEKSRVVGLVYSILVGLVVFSIKFIVWRLHYLLDKNDPIVNENVTPVLSKLELNKSNSVDDINDNYEDIEARCRQIGLRGLEIADQTDAIVRNWNTSENKYKSDHTLLTISKMDLEKEDGEIQFSDPSGRCMISIYGNKTNNEDYFNEEKAQVVKDSFEEESTKALDDFINDEQLDVAKDRVSQHSLVEKNSSLLEFNNNRNTEVQSIFEPETASQTLSSTFNRSLLPVAARRFQICRQFSETNTRNARELQRLYSLCGQSNRIVNMRFGHAMYDQLTDVSSDFLTNPPGRHENIDDCKLLLEQLRRDVSCLPRNSPRTSSDMHPNSLINPQMLVRSRSQRYRGGLTLDLERRQRAVVCIKPSNLLLGRMSRNAHLTDLSLTDTILFWQKYRESLGCLPTKLQRLHSLDQSRDLHRQCSFEGSHAVDLHKLPETCRSHSLRNELVMPRMLLFCARRPVSRRPGSMLRLKRQLSAGSTSLSYNVPIQSDFDVEFASLDKDLVTSEKPLVCANEHGDNGNNEDVDEDKQDDKGNDDSTNAVVSNYQIEEECKDKPLSETDTSVGAENCDSPSTNDGLFWRKMRSSYDSTPHRLTRQYGIRRHKISLPKLETPVQLLDESNANAVKDDQTVSNWKLNLNQNVDLSNYHNSSVEETFETMLARLMGVGSLADAGLTKQECFMKLLGNGHEFEELERVEMDIMSAVMDAITNSADCQPTKSDCSELQQVAMTSFCEPSSSRCPVSVNQKYDLPLTTEIRSQSETGHRESQQLDSQQSVPQIERADSRRSHRSFVGHLYNLHLFRFLPCGFHVKLNRPKLDALFDRNLTLFESFISVFLSILVALIGFHILCWGNFRDFGPVACCFTIAGCHYSLIKSVQPDPASPKHGYNRIIVFSRSIYFCLIAFIHFLTHIVEEPSKLFYLIGFASQPLSRSIHSSFMSLMASHINVGELQLVANLTTWSNNHHGPMLNAIGDPTSKSSIVSVKSTTFWRFSHLDHFALSSSTAASFFDSTIHVYGLALSINCVLVQIRTVCTYLIVIYPILFCVGLMPQINTFLIYLLEQLDIHVFGSSGTTGLMSVLFSISRSLFLSGLAFVPLYYALETQANDSVLLAYFWALQIAFCYVLSRLPSNVHLYTTLLPSRSQLTFECGRLWSKASHLCTATYQSIRRCIIQCLHCRRKSKFKPDSPRSSTDTFTWWRQLPLLIPNLGLKSSIYNQTMGESQLESGVVCNDSDGDDNCDDKKVTRGRVISKSRISLDETSDARRKKRNLKAFAKYCSLPIENAHLLEDSHSPDLYLSSSQSANKSSTRPNGTQLSPNCDLAVSGHVRSLNRLSSSSMRSNKNCHDIELIADGEFRPIIKRNIKSVPILSKLDKSESGQSTTVTATSIVQLPSCQSSMVNVDQTAGLDEQFPIFDPLPAHIRTSLKARFKNDLIVCLVWFVLAFVLCYTRAIDFIRFPSVTSKVFIWISVAVGCVCHYVWPNLRQPYPWLLFEKAFIPPQSNGKLIVWESIYFFMCCFERNIVIPFITLLTVSEALTLIVNKFGTLFATLIVVVTSMKLLRNGFCCAGQTYLNLFFTDLLFAFDIHYIDETFPINYFFISIFVNKLIEFFKKLHFLYVYMAPCSIIWGSLAHAIIQLASIPHMFVNQDAVFMFANCIFSTVLSAPLEPFTGSVIFITSYVRPISFWETNHCTQRLETTNMPIAVQLRGVSRHQLASNLDGIFYEHLTRKLQRNLAGDLQLGRLGGLSVGHGDVFILSMDNLNLVIHIIEIGNGFVTFQLRGLEFAGTLCHMSETESLRSDMHRMHRCCFCDYKPPKGLLSFNSAFRLRCMTWQCTYNPYVIEGYEVTDHSAALTFQLTDLRKVLISRFIRCIIYFVTKLPDLSKRLDHLSSSSNWSRFSNVNFLDLDPIFFKLVDEDFDEEVNGVTRKRFVQMYLPWIVHCLKKHKHNASLPSSANSSVVTLCFALSLLGRRCMGGTQSNKHVLDQFLHGVNQVFCGDINLNLCDDWVLTDLDLLQCVITPAIRIALKLYQDTFTWNSECTYHELYNKIVFTERNIVICRETDPKWRFAVLNDADCLFSFRWIADHSMIDMYRIVQLTKHNLEFRVIKLNSECVRGLWAGQQREQIFLRNKNHERGSIQSAPLVLRNLVNSSCDPPIGYPIYVSPLITSFAADHPLYKQVAGDELSLVGIVFAIRRLCSRLCHFVVQICTGTYRRKVESDKFTDVELANVHATAGKTDDLVYADAISPYNTTFFSTAADLFAVGGSATNSAASANPTDVSSTNTTLTATIHQHQSQHNDESLLTMNTLVQNSANKNAKVEIVDPTQILNGYLGKLTWPNNEWRLQCLTYSACASSVYAGLEANIIHRWTPSHFNLTSRSFCHQNIVLLGFSCGPPLLDGHYVAIWEEKGIREISP